jgi:hypothetical protein
VPATTVPATTVPAATVRPEVFAPDPAAPRVVFDLDPAAHWVAEQYPNEGVVRRPGDVLRVTLRAGQRAWLERLLLRAGPHATLVEGDGSIRAVAARRLLRRYRSPNPSSPNPQ